MIASGFNISTHKEKIMKKALFIFVSVFMLSMTSYAMNNESPQDPPQKVEKTVKKLKKDLKKDLDKGTKSIEKATKKVKKDLKKIGDDISGKGDKGKSKKK